ncbi:uncharacterized protein LOC122663265 [Telopea speciosissima]|uniref:uncharacterized protein LOC122663265 n=1 Tax=Telopea speciosissima TaxID=54955 RepID=UPI001CC6B1A8|nr:uncharacterized protein LOC122663265 [Telopea speciosissima]
MMNVLALFLVLSSLTTASIWSTPPETLETEKKKAREEDVIMREGRRLIVVEYEKETPLHPKVSISPPEQPDLTHKLPGQSVGDKLSDVAMATKEKAMEATAAASDQSVGDKLSDVGKAAKEKAKEAASVLPNLGQGLSTSTQSQPPEPPPLDSPRAAPPREFICDALGKCKNKLAGVLGKAKDKAQGGAEQAKDKAKDVIDTTKTTGENLAGKAEEIAEDVADRVKTKAHHLKEEGKDNLTDILRRGREVVLDAIRYMMSRERWAALMGVGQLLGFATAYGTCVWVTFVSSYVLAGVLQRQQFGIVQSKIYPVYFKTMAYSIGLSLVGLWFNPRSRRSKSVQSYNLLASLVMILANLFYLEPQATKVMFEKMKIEKEEGRGIDDADISGARTLREEENSKKVKSRLRWMNQRLKKLNTQSSFLNVLTLMALTWHLVELGQRLHLSC